MSVCRIFAGGELGSISAEDITAAGGFVICADSGYSHALRLGIKPDIIVGDFDSYEGSLPADCRIIRTVPEKDDTDTLMAVKEAIKLGYDTILLYGALGGPRFDHALANVQTMLYAREQGAELILCGSETVYLQGAGERIYKRSQDRRYFSVFAVTESVQIRYMTGVKYPLRDYCMRPSFPIGVSNEITGSEAALCIDSGLALVIRS